MVKHSLKKLFNAPYRNDKMYFYPPVNQLFTVMNHITLHIKACPLGYFGNNCSVQCPHPSFGLFCGETCNCSQSECDPALGCSKYDNERIKKK